jgi:hypothetical protein
MKRLMRAVVLAFTFGVAMAVAAPVQADSMCIDSSGFRINCKA